MGCLAIFLHSFTRQTSTRRMTADTIRQVKTTLDSSRASPVILNELLLMDTDTSVRVGPRPERVLPNGASSRTPSELCAVVQSRPTPPVADPRVEVEHALDIDDRRDEAVGRACNTVSAKAPDICRSWHRCAEELLRFFVHCHSLPGATMTRAAPARSSEFARRCATSENLAFFVNDRSSRLLPSPRAPAPRSPLPPRSPRTSGVGK
jgi:hypothetical protein